MDTYNRSVGMGGTKQSMPMNYPITNEVGAVKSTELPREFNRLEDRIEKLSHRVASLSNHLAPVLAKGWNEPRPSPLKDGPTEGCMSDYGQKLQNISNQVDAMIENLNALIQGIEV
jgi:hypothetical protein